MIFLPSRMYLLQQLSDALACHQVGVSGCGGEGAAAVVWTPLTSHLPRSETRHPEHRGHGPWVGGGSSDSARVL